MLTDTGFTMQKYLPVAKPYNFTTESSASLTTVEGGIAILQSKPIVQERKCF